MNYIILFFYVFLMFYGMYIFHETYLKHYYNVEECITKYAVGYLVVCMLLFVFPSRYFTMILFGGLILFPSYMYYKKKGYILQLAVYYVLLCVSIVSYVFIRYIMSIVPTIMLPFSFEIDILFLNLFMIISLLYLQRKHVLYKSPYVIIILIGVLLSTYLYLAISIKYPIRLDQIQLALPMGLTLCMNALFRLCYSMETSKDNVLDMTIQRYADKENKEKFEIIEKENKMILQQMHDMKKHLHMLDEMKGQEELFASYKAKIEQKAEDILYTKYTGDVLVDRILQTYRSKLQDAKIQFNIEADTIDYTYIDMIDISAILSNLLDNAIESCLLCEERALLLKIKKKDNFIVIKMKNSCKAIKEEHGKLITMKEDSLYHGYGMHNMSMIAKKYEGELNYRFHAEHQLFITSITMFLDRL